MTRKQKRLSVILGGLAILSVAAGLVLYALSDKVTFFYTPSDVTERQVAPGTRIRLGGMVEKGSWKKGQGARNEFVVTDTLKTMSVSYVGVLPDLFREGQGVVTEGVIDAAGHFTADTVLAKHDEKYMPKDVADRLKAKGVKMGQGAGS
jgi:cytochrome c-type biogenesis protein CcmE